MGAALDDHRLELTPASRLFAFHQSQSKYDAQGRFSFLAARGMAVDLSHLDDWLPRVPTSTILEGRKIEA